ncbi:cell division protein Fic [Psychroflexus salis]|uniref:Cell division protein Fic n=1 Tax=Psychroflexus salis TaxID=1526574 RepID=A0A917E567_9FLAO|nr:cell division protein Fic [Psychroflexus salis]
MQSLGFELKNEANLATLTLDIIKSNEIEGEYLNQDQVRSSIARKLGLEIAGSVNSDRYVDGVVELMLEATQNYSNEITKTRLCNWHAGLFPTGRSGIFKIQVADWRTVVNGPIQVVSGSIGKEKIHFQAPDAKLVNREMIHFLDWINASPNIDLIIKAAIAHLWFLTIHPFEDGNGRIALAITDLLLARSDKSPQRFYSMSSQIHIKRNQYYQILEDTQKGNLDVTNWIVWFLTTLIETIESTELVLNRIFLKADFWNMHAKTIMNQRQKNILNKILDGFEGKLTSSKWAKITKCSKDTAVRDINDLVKKNILKKENAGGRSTSYELVKIDE